jgi:protein-disulfide isomerase
LSWGAAQSAPVPTPEAVAELPEAVAREQQPGVATIVEFADFECPYCRRQHEVLNEVLAAYGPRVRFVRKHVPLSRIHPHAEHAARAACCAEEQGRGEAMADALFRSEDLSPEACATTAARLGLNVQEYAACLTAPRIDARLEQDRNAATNAGVHGLPTMFVGRERFGGVVPAEQLRASIERALAASTTAPAAAPRPNG